MKCFYTLVFSVFFLFSSLYSQTLVNLNWNENFGAPDTSISWSATKIDGGGNLLTVGNTIVAGEGTNLLLTCHDQDGTLMWQSDHHNANATDQFGIGVAEDASGNIYVCGSSTNSAIFSGSDSDYLIVKYNSQGVEQWARTYNGPDDGEDVAVAIAVSSGGDVFVTGMSEDTTSGYDFATIKYNSSGTQQWVQRYDRQNLEDVAVWIGTDVFGNAYVTGASGTSTNDWDIATLVYTSSGVKINEQVYTNVGTGYDRPTDMGFDNQGNIYITGTSSVDGIDYDIVTLKLNSSFQLQWVKTHDEAGLVDEARSLTVDNSGNIYVTGFVTKLSGKCLITIKYDTNGNVIWKETLGQGSQSVGDDISIHNNGDLIISGQQLNSSSSDAMALSFDSGGNLKWLTVQPTHNEASEPSTRLTMDAQGRAYVSSITQETTTPSYAVQQYDIYQASEDIALDSTGKPLYLERQLIVRFRDSALNYSAIDNNEIAFSSPDFFLNPEETIDFYSKVPTDPGVYTFIRAFPNMKTTDTLAISRLEEEIPVPKFWTTFVIDAPLGVDILEMEDSLETLGFVAFAHPNYLGQPDADANDSLFSLQHALFSTQYPMAHVNVKPAWDIETGKPKIRVGVIDSGLDWRHPDFGYDGMDSASSVVINGYDYQTSTPLKEVPDPEPPAATLKSHGTKAAGIIGAKRNNTIGVAGIAGGNGDSLGVSLYGLKTFEIVEQEPNLISMAIASRAIINSAQKNTSTPPKPDFFELHIMNTSWGFNETTSENDMLREAVRFAYRLKVIQVTSRGNEGKITVKYPQVFDDDWVISVGGSDTTADKHPSSDYGLDVDLMAPYSSSMHWSTTRQGGYGPYSGTSAATPVVSGVAALILSYLNDFDSQGFRCAPEDVEYILQKTARDITTAPADSGYDDWTGHGLLDAGAALLFIDTAEKTILHRISNSSNAQITSDTVLQNKTIDVTELYDPILAFQIIKKGIYKANIYRIEATVANQLPPGKTILDAWPRHSSSNVFPELISSDELIPHLKVSIDQVNDDSTKLSGYIYEITDSMGSIITIPTSSTGPIGKRLAYSLLLVDSPVGLDDLDEGVEIHLFPNPASIEQTIKINFDQSRSLSINLVDIQGKRIEKVFTRTSVVGEFSINNDISNLSPGFYVYQFQIDKRTFYLKFVKY